MTEQNHYGTMPRKSSHSLMDRMPVCGIGDPGSIPGESTNAKYPYWDILHLCSHQAQLFDRKAWRESKPD